MRIQAYRLAPYTPYVAVAFGIYGLHSALAALGIYHAAMLAFIAAGPRSASLPAKRRFHAYWAPLLAVFFGLGGVLLFVLWPLLGQDAGMVCERLGALGVTKDVWPYFATYFCIANSMLEELFWRGRLGSESRVLTSNDLLFAGYHSLVLVSFASPFWTAPVFIACALAGWVWRRLRSASGGLALPILTHVVADVGIVVAVHMRAFQ